TPPAVARLLCDWVARVRPHNALDPAAGTGVLVRELHRQWPECRKVAVELDPVAAAAFRASVPSDPRIELVTHDFLTWPSTETFDAVVANPPYLRHHDLHYSFDIFKEIGSRNQVRLTRLTNAYGLFLLEMSRRLRPGGRAAVILPSEWLNANFGQPLKEYLLARGLVHYLICFQEDVFPDALTTACILLIEKPHGATRRDSLTTIWVRSPELLGSLDELLNQSVARGPTHFTQSLTARQLPAAAKWTPLVEHGAHHAYGRLVPLGQLAATRRGIATGANHFFHLSQTEWDAAGIAPRSRKACVGRASDAEGLVFTAADFEQLVRRDRRTWLVDIEGTPTAAERAYLARGEREGLPQRYLLAARRPWYRMEQRQPAPIWAAVFGRRGLRFLLNEAGVYHLTTFHGIYPHDARPQFAKALAAVLNSSIVQQRARQQQRVYGGGLRKFEPRDLLELEVPDVRHAPPELLGALAE